jgi:hypothetical protein
MFLDHNNCSFTFKNPFIIAALIVLAPWFLIQSQLSINLDIAWLMTGALRLLEGYSMSEYIYEPNPPLAILIHLPPALVTIISGMPIYYSSFLYFSVLVLLSGLYFFRTLEQLDFLSVLSKQSIFLAFIILSSIMTSTDYGERDHLISLALFPCILNMLALSYNWKPITKAQFLLFFICALFIYLKPYHLLLPAFILLHRMILKKEFFSVILAPDSLAFIIVGILYSLACLIYFQDYLTMILPDVMSLYIVGGKFSALINTAFFILASLILYAFSFIGTFPQDEIKLLRWLIMSALISVIPFAIQMLDLYYHLLPALTFLLVATIYLCALHINKHLSQSKTAIIIFLMCFTCSYMIFPLKLSYPTHSKYNNLPLSQAILSCKECKNFFMFTQQMRILQPTITYSELEHVSRFPAYWFLPQILVKLDRNQPEGSTLAKKYRQLTTEDFKRYKPDLVLIEKFKILKSSSDAFDFITFHSENSEFRNLWENYEFLKTIRIKRGQYFPNTKFDDDKILIIDLYKRKEV